MGSKTYCPFLKGDCIEDCMFYCIGGSPDNENTTRHCLIAKTLLEIPDSNHQEKAWGQLISAINHP